MYTPRFSPRRWPGINSVPAARADDAVRSGGHTPVVQLRDEIDKLFDDMFQNMLSPWTDFGVSLRGRPVRLSGIPAVAPRLDVSSDEKMYTITVELPGVSPGDVSLEVRENVLSLRGEKKQERKEENADVHINERSFGSFERALALPDDAVSDEIKASHKDGVLTISIPRREPEKPASRTISINQE
jgi:HSP20 family protein